jgi:hypothetical protein
VQMNRFKCPSADCPRRTFAESIGSLAGRHQRRTRSQARALHALGHALGGEPAARLATALGFVPVLTPYCGSCEGLPGASADHLPESSASTTRGGGLRP